MIRPSRRLLILPAVGAVIALLLSGCGDEDEPRAFTLRFAAVDGAAEVGCGDVLTGFGTDGLSRVEISDLRFYVSNLRFYNADGDELDVSLDENAFQYVSGDGAVGLIDLTGTTTGACSGAGEVDGTARTNAVLTGTVEEGTVTRVAFDVGIPQPMMKRVIANNTAEDAPSPLAEMHWSWGFAYRHLLVNFTIRDAANVAGPGFLHIGSTDCGGDGSRALTDRTSCGRVNTPAVSLTGFDPDNDVVALNVRELLEGVELKRTVEATQLPGCACHSNSSQADCPPVFGNLGVTPATGVANAALNEVFEIK